jgi:cell division septal protein FtsQ
MSEHKQVTVERKEERKTNNNLLGATFIKYAAYLVIFFGIIWFLITYILPMFQ